LVPQAEAFVVGHEKEPVFAIEQFGDLHRSAKSEAKLIPLEGSRHWDRARKAERPGIQGVVPQEVE